jgi:hypothetical protein
VAVFAVLLAGAALLAVAHECTASDRFVAVAYHDITAKPVVPEDLTPDQFMKQLAFFR